MNPQINNQLKMIIYKNGLNIYNNDMEKNISKISSFLFIIKDIEKEKESNNNNNDIYIEEEKNFESKYQKEYNLNLSQYNSDFDCNSDYFPELKKNKKNK
ncbi:hypothetical protein M0811_14627 [Anaeramoeba ignava]|uniref:Uncharacterized protein n=1 Tax=Anaeramoeba ignava TaxID=1746090 RepID=A0A9Q0LUC3_ANAIG|nr:hypothetical protein M0811_14627 [Anaeramoeba ignava]